MQWQVGIRSCSVDRLLSACLFAFDWDDDGFACSKTMEISNLSRSLSHDYHHAYSLQLRTGKMESNNTSERVQRRLTTTLWNSCCLCLSFLVVVLAFWRFGAGDDVTERSLVVLLKCFSEGHMCFCGAYDHYL
jgi:hypothetical protein